MGEKSAHPSDKILALLALKRDVGIGNINELPTEILEHILSFLGVKDAIRTSILSKRWEYLWRSISDLEFEETSYANRDLFMDVIDRMLLLRDRHPIKNFKLGCDISRNSFRVSTWISAVARANVEKCTLRLTKVPRAFMLSRCLLTCNTLVELHLDLDVPLSLPSHSHLPSLKSLHLEHVTFLDECSTQRLLSSSPIESLYILHCCWGALRAISASSPKLKRFHLAKCFSLDFETSDDCCQVTIRDCNLESIYLERQVFCEYAASNLSAANVSLAIDFESLMDCPNQSIHLKKFLL